MATKTANVLARVEPDVKEKAEAIMTQLGIPASVVINMLYKQIVMTRSIPFSLSLPMDPMPRDGMDAAMFNSMMERGLNEAKRNHSKPVDEVFSELRQEIR